MISSTSFSPLPGGAQVAPEDDILRVELVRVPRGRGMLDVRRAWIGDVCAYELFDLRSLTSALGLTQTQLEYQYRRVGLKRITVSVANEFGRPIRCLPLAAYRQVADAMATRRVRLHRTAAGEFRNVRVGQARLVDYLVMLDAAEPVAHFTIRAIARAFGVTQTTVTNRLRVAGLLELGVLRKVPGGGRPAKAYPLSLLGEIYIAMCDMDLRDAHADMQHARGDGRVASGQRLCEAAVRAPGEACLVDPLVPAPGAVPVDPAAEIDWDTEIAAITGVNQTAGEPDGVTVAP